MIRFMRWLFLLFAAWNFADWVWGESGNPELRFWTALTFLGLTYLANHLSRRSA